MVKAKIYRGYAIGGISEMEFKTIQEARDWFINNSFKVTGINDKDLSFTWFEKNNYEGTPVVLKEI